MRPTSRFPREPGWALCAVFVAAVVPIAVFYTARTEAGAVGLPSTAEPLVSVLLAYAVLGESLGARQLAGGALIVLSAIRCACCRHASTVEDVSVSPTVS